MSDFGIIAIGALGAGVLLVAIVSGPGPDPRLAAESLPAIARSVVIPFAGYLAISFLVEALPGDIPLPVVIAASACGLVATAWWYRRHPSRPDRVAPVEAPGGSAPVEEAVISGGEWLRALIPVALVVALVVVLVAVGSSLAYPV